MVVVEIRFKSLALTESGEPFGGTEAVEEEGGGGPKTALAKKESRMEERMEKRKKGEWENKEDWVQKIATAIR